MSCPYFAWLTTLINDLDRMITFLVGVLLLSFHKTQKSARIILGTGSLLLLSLFIGFLWYTWESKLGFSHQWFDNLRDRAELNFESVKRTLHKYLWPSSNPNGNAAVQVGTAIEGEDVTAQPMEYLATPSPRLGRYPR